MYEDFPELQKYLPQAVEVDVNYSPMKSASPRAQTEEKIVNFAQSVSKKKGRLMASVAASMFVVFIGALMVASQSRDLKSIRAQSLSTATSAMGILALVAGVGVWVHGGRSEQ